MTKNQIAIHLAREFGLKRRCAKRILDYVLDEIMQGAVQDGRVPLRGFGTFQVRWRAARTYPHLRKPGETVYVPAHPIVCFKPGKEFRGLLCQARLRGTIAGRLTFDYGEGGVDDGEAQEG